MNRINNTGLLIATGLLIFSCKPDDSARIQKKMDEQIQERLQAYIQNEKKRCKVKILEEASTLADSILRANPVFISLDSLQRPPIPLKPPKPEFERKKDSFKLAPILPVERKEE